jgi:co-chaperonin GroES (HSP10)
MIELTSSRLAFEKQSPSRSDFLLFCFFWLAQGSFGAPSSMLLRYLGVKKMKVTPLFKRYIVFAMPRRSKTKSGLYIGNDARGSYNRTEGVWIVEKGREGTMDVNRGDHCLIHDAFELDTCGLDLWPEMQDLPEFSALKKLQQEFDGQVVTRIVTEHSLLCVDNEYLASSEDRGVWLKYSDL